MEIAGLCGRGLCERLVLTNAFGDRKIALDVAGEGAVMAALRGTGSVAVVV